MSTIRLNVNVGDTVWFARRTHDGCWFRCCGPIQSISWQRVLVPDGNVVEWNEAYTDEAECQEHVEALNAEAAACGSP